MGKNIKLKLSTLEKAILQESSQTMKMTMDVLIHTLPSSADSKEMPIYRLLELALKTSK